jgi:hypothetical protein
MRKTEFHRIDGVGHPVEPSDRQLNPKTYEQTIHGLQATILRLARIEEHTRTEDEYNPDHKRFEEDNGMQMIRVDEDSVLYDVIRCLPRRWNVTIVNDVVMDNSYAVRASVDCGGCVTVEITAYINGRTGGGSMFSKFRVAHTSVFDRSERVCVSDGSDLTIHTSSRVLANINRYLESTVREAYAATIPSAATAFDYINTKDDIQGSGKRVSETGERIESANQTEWAEIRGKTPQTVSDNVGDARGELPNSAEVPFRQGVQPALRQGSEEDTIKQGTIYLA